MSYNEYLNACRYLNEGLIRQTPVNNGVTNREWMHKFLNVIGHPEKSFPAIHVAGTSGKGSIATMIAEILRAQGLKVGLHTSPYLQTPCEKIWVNGSYISADDFVSMVDWVKPFAEKFKTPEVPIHNLVSLAIALEYFKRQKVDVAVIEVGVGGLNDTTNVLDSVATVVGAIGMDHVELLGPTLDDIARHKFGIAKKGVPLIFNDGSFNHIAQEISASTGAELLPIKEGVNYSRLTDDPQDTRFNYRGILALDNLFTTLDGKFQTGNAALAIAAAEQATMMLGRNIGEQAIRNGLMEARLPARLEVMKRRPRVILDGAHNPQKLEASLKVLCADRFRGKLIAVIGLLATKDAHAMAKILKEYCRDAIVTEPVAYGKKALPAAELAKILEDEGIMVRIEHDPNDALHNAIAYSHGDDRILVTGSLYLAGQLREQYYATDKIVDAHQSWPR